MVLTGPSAADIGRLEIDDVSEKPPTSDGDVGDTRATSSVKARRSAASVERTIRCSSLIHQFVHPFGLLCKDARLLVLDRSQETSGRHGDARRLRRLPFVTRRGAV